MGKSFKTNRPIDNLNNQPEQSKPIASVPEDKPVAAVEPKATDQTKAKRKVGRPKTKDVKGTCKNINVAVPISLLDKWEEIKIVHGSNLTDYITKLIEKDMDANYNNYKYLADSLKNI